MMIDNIKLLGLVFFLFLAINTQAQPPVIEGMVAYYSFDNCDATDESGNASDGQIIGSPNCVCGVSGNALELDGINDHIIFLGIVNNYFDTDDFAVSFYFKSFGSPFPQDILSKRENCTPNNSLNVNFVPNQNAIINTLAEDPSKIADAEGTLDFDNCWHHVVITRRGGFTLLYLDGVLVTEEQVISRVDISNNGLLALADSPCLGQNVNRFKGYFDELTVYSRHLLEEDVEKLYINPDKIGNSDTLIYLGGQVETFIPNSCATSFEWFPKTGVTDSLSGTTTLSPSETTTYQLNFTDANGCTATDEIVVTVIDPSQLDCSQIFVPKAFTPNGTGPGVNETIGISNPYALEALTSFEIFDRWGERVFFTDNAFEQWDGRFKGKALNPGVFLYKMKYRCNGEEQSNFGSLSLIR